MIYNWRMIVCLICFYLFLLLPQILLASDHSKVIPGIFIEESPEQSKPFLALDIEIHLKEPQDLYQWRGSIYPMAKIGDLQIDLVSSEGEKLGWEILVKVMPKYPHPLDKVSAKDYRYERPLKLKITKPEGEIFKGCGDVVLTYDTKDNHYFKMHGFSLIRLTSNKLKFCLEN